MPRQPVDIRFGKGLDTKTDPWQIAIGMFLRLVNAVFTKGGLLLKRNGFAQLPSLPNPASYVTTLNGNLTAIGQNIQALILGERSWISKGNIAPLSVNTLPLIRNSINQTQSDTAIAANGLICIVYTEVNNGTSSYKYAIADSQTGQNVVSPTVIPVSSGTVTGSPRVFYLGNYFVVVFTNVITATSHLQYISISAANPLIVTTNQNIAVSYAPATTLSWDGVVFSNNLYLAYNTTAGGQSIKVTYLSISAAALGQTPASPTTYTGAIATMMSLCADPAVSATAIYIAFYDSASQTGYVGAVDTNLNKLAAFASPVQIITTGVYLNIIAAAQNGVCKVFFELQNAYSYDSGVPTNRIQSRTVTFSGVTGSTQNSIRSVGIASKAFIINGTIYFLSVYQSPFQSTYFLINGSLTDQSAPMVVAKLAYQNAGGYLPEGLPSVQVNGVLAQFSYLFKDFIAASATVSTAPDTAIPGVYSQTGIKLASITFGTGIDAAEIASNLHISGGYLWQYDGYLPVEHNFFLYPDSVECTWSATGGSIHAQPDGVTNADAYFYQATYEWEDNQGNVYRSTPSLPIAVTTTGNGTSGSITVNVPYLRLTSKIANPPKIVIYRWSVAQPVFYRVTSLTAVQLNNPSADSLAYVDTLADPSILGNDILYTTGGVFEDTNAPATNIITLFDTRLWLVDAEDQNLLWYSKQVIEATPVEMSDLLTFYIAPTTAAQGSTGPITALAPLDDKLIIFKANAIYYINGTGPDNTGSNNQYSQPIFITSTVGCANQQSIVFMPQGLMFQSNKGIWLLGRDLQTSYIGAGVEAFNTSIVTSAVNVPQTNQVRFTLNTGEELMYDYYYGQWGTFDGVPAVSSTIYNGLHSIINSFGQSFQESPGVYLDGSNPVLLSLLTGWINVAGLQGYQRAYFLFLLGQYFSPHKLQVRIAYDYNPSFESSCLVRPTNFSPNYGGSGSDSANPYGQQGQYGGPSSVEDWRIFFSRQRCQAFQIAIDEVYDPSFGIPAGAGLTLSGMNLVVAVKKGWRTIGAKHSQGAS